ncbi:MAG: ABC transporter ATP-binding protein [Clostridia bacterium]|nr:ABC transporter ATP-binding protein [Clostridia bacterium]
MKKITVNNLKVVYKDKKRGNVTALENFSTVVFGNAFNVVIGYSGCGKTTFLRAVAGLIEYEGDIFFDDVDAFDLTVKDRNIAMVSQEYALYPHINVFDNIAYPLVLAGAPRSEIIERVNNLAEYFGIKHCLTRKPKHLSGGQQQKVALARAMIKMPQLYLFDEPLSNFDPQKRYEARQMIKKAVKDHGATAIYVTHDLNEAMELADNVIVIDKGKVEISGNPAYVFNSHDEVVESLKSKVDHEQFIR